MSGLALALDPCTGNEWSFSAVESARFRALQDIECKGRKGRKVNS